MTAKSLALLLAVLLLGVAVSVRAATLDEVVRTLERPFQAAAPAGVRINDYRAEFAQEARIAALDRAQRAKGRVSVRFDRSRSGQEPVILFHWEYREPSPQELVSDGKTLWVYLPENNQVIVSPVDHAATPRENDPMVFLTGLGNLSRDFRVGFATPGRDDQGNYLIELRPRAASALFERMLVTVSQAAVEATVRGGLIFPIVATTVIDPSGNSTRIEFSAVRINTNIPAADFRFTPPPGVDVVRPGGQP